MSKSCRLANARSSLQTCMKIDYCFCKSQSKESNQSAGNSVENRAMVGSSGKTSTSF